MRGGDGSAEFEFAVAPPKMHWQIGTPQEQILDFVREMKHNMQCVPNESWPYKQKNAERDAYIHAYATVEKHIVRYMKLWED